MPDRELRSRASASAGTLIQSRTPISPARRRLSSSPGKTVTAQISSRTIIDDVLEASRWVGGSHRLTGELFAPGGFNLNQR